MGYLVALGMNQDRTCINQQFMIMKKKLYVIPSLEVVEMECVSIILAGSTPKVDVEVGDDIGDGFTQDTKKHDGFMNHTWE